MKKDDYRIFMKEQPREFIIYRNWEHYTRASLKEKQQPVVDATGDGSQVSCCKEQYCIGTWNVRSMNQDKLETGDGKSERQHSRNQ